MRPWLFFAGLTCLLLAATASARENPADLLQQARAAYDRGAYAEASTDYRQLLAQGLNRAEVYYNLGNAEFKAGHLGRAIAAYRQALKRAPGDEDVLFNLEYARRFVQQPQDQTGQLTRLAGRLLTAFSGQALALTALGAYVGLAVLVMFWLLARDKFPGLRWLLAGISILFVVLASWASVRIVLERIHRWGVVIAGQAEARNGPSAEYQVGFIVPEGREVRLLGREGDWIAIGLPAEGYKGWVKSADILPE